MDFELLILTIERDVEKLAFGMPLLRRYLSPSRTVFVASKACLTCLESAGIPQEGDLTIPEDEILGGLQLSFVRELLKARGADPRRCGWYFKQLVIFAYAARPEAAELYLVWDADTVPLREMSFFDQEGRVIFDVAPDLHLPYFETMKNMIGVERQVDYSFISDHMLLEKKIALALIDRIVGGQVPTGEVLARKALSAISDEGLIGSCGFSEYETYGNFVAANFPDRFVVRQSSRTRMGSSFFGLPPSRTGLFALSLKYSWANFESPTLADRSLRRRLKNRAYRAVGFFWAAAAALLHPKALADFRS
jgi:hypothetical protein